MCGQRWPRSHCSCTHTVWSGHSPHYENARIQIIILRILPPKHENFQMKNSGSFHISAQNIDCGYSLEPPRRGGIDCGYSLEPPRRGGSNEYPQSMFLSRNKKANVYHCKPHVYCIKVGFKGVKLYRRVSVMCPLTDTLDNIEYIDLSSFKDKTSIFI